MLREPVGGVTVQGQGFGSPNGQSQPSPQCPASPKCPMGVTTQQQDNMTELQYAIPTAMW